MNQRDDVAGFESDRGRESNGRRDFYPGSHGFEDADERRPGGWASSERRRFEQQRFEGGRDPERWRGRDFAGSGRQGWEASASQPYYGPRAQGGERSSWHGQDPYGFGQRAHWRESHREPYRHEQPFDREPFSRNEEPRYYGTGAPGWGGPGFTGGAYGYGTGSREPRRSIDDAEYSDESAVSYEGYDRAGYGRGSGSPYQNQSRPFARGPKGYQRSDERMKEDISEKLWTSRYIDSSEVSIEVRGGKVTLEGTVPSRHMKHAIEDLVDACLGVQDIDNRIRVASPNYQGSAPAASTGGTGSMSGAGSTSGTTVTGSTPAKSSK
jgi:hypothetical protein